MEKFEKFLRILSLVFGSIVFGFIAWLMLIYPYFGEPWNFVLGGGIAGLVLTVIIQGYNYFVGD